MDAEFPFCKMKQFWSWLVVTAAQLCECVYATELYTKKVLNGKIYHNSLKSKRRNILKGENVMP